MKTNYLLPNQCKKIGWFLFIPGFILGILQLIFEFKFDWLNIKVFAIYDPYFSFANNGFTSHNLFFHITKTNALDEILGLLLIIGSIFIALSKEKSEDEFISKIRLESLVWATYVNYAILALAILFVFNISFYYVMIFNMFTLLIFFIIRFNWMIYKLKKSIKNEE